MTYEQRRHALLSRPTFVRRAVRHVLYAGVIALLAVGMGTLGYHTVGRLEWIDAFLNAFSGLVFVAVAGVIVAPWIHRLFHWFHLEER